MLRFSVLHFVPRRVISVRTSPYRKFVSCAEICSYTDERRAEQKRPGESRLISPCFEPRLIAASKTSPRRLSFPLSFLLFSLSVSVSLSLSLSLSLSHSPVQRTANFSCNFLQPSAEGWVRERARAFTEERSSHSRLAVPNTFPIFVLRHSLNHRPDRGIFAFAGQHNQ